MNKCPICGEHVEQYHEVPFKEPYTHTNPFDGIYIYGAFSAPKSTICHEHDFLHFAFYDADGFLINHRLVKLGVENPSTPSPTDEYMEGIIKDEDEDDWDVDDDYNPFDGEEFPNGSLDY